MIAGKTITVVIPAHNEAEGLKVVLPAISREVDEVIVVDNASDDATADVARSFGATVVAESRRGYGRAYQTGFAAARGDIIVTLDGDGQYPAGDIPTLVHALVDRQLDFLSACRFPLAGESMPLLRQVGNHLLTFATRLLFGTAIKDTQSGMWIFERRILDTVHPTQIGMPFSEELKVKTLLAGLKFGEEHITYLPRVGESKLVPWHDGWENLKYLVKLRLS